MHGGVCVAWWVACAAIALAGRDARGDDDPYAPVLAEQGIRADAAGVVGYLRQMLPTDQNRRELAVLVAQLGSEDYAQREAATRRLLAWPRLPGDELRRAARSGDPEVRLRAEQILASAGSAPAGTLVLASLRTIERGKFAGAAATLLEVMPLLAEEHLRAAAGAALVAAATDGDLPLLRRAANGGQPVARAAAAGALATRIRDAEELRAVVAAGDDGVRLAVARAMANRGDRRALELLGPLLASADAAVRQGTIRALRGFTGQDLPYVAAEAPEKQGPLVAAWQRWIGQEGRTAKLYFPLAAGTVELGRTLICEQSAGRVVEVDAHGKVTLEVRGVRYPWGCQGLPNGHRLVAQYSDRRVVEYDAAGAEVWRKDDLPGGPVNVKRLETGNTLIPCSDANKVVEVDREGKTVWEVAIEGRPTDARRLETGNTLIALHFGKRVVEVDRNGREVWQIESLQSPVGAQRLENGNTLVCDSGLGQVTEYARNGTAVWSQGGYSNCWDAQRLPSGATLIADSKGVREVDRAGKTVWEYEIGSARAVRY